MDDGLLNRLRALVSKNGVFELGREDAAAFLHGVATTLGVDDKRRWWWEAVEGGFSYHYGDYGEDAGLGLLESLVAPDAESRFVPTDDEFGPWPVFGGRFARILTVIRELQFFEFFIGAPNGSWLVFDTHDNELVTLGLPSMRSTEF